MRRIGHILEHSPNNLGQLLHGNRQAGPGETTPTRLAVTCKQWTRAPTMAGVSGQMLQHRPQDGIAGSQTSPLVAEEMVGEIPSIKAHFPDSGRMMWRGRTHRAQLHLQTVAHNTLTRQTYSR